MIHAVGSGNGGRLDSAGHQGWPPDPHQQRPEGGAEERPASRGDHDLAAEKGGGTEDTDEAGDAVLARRRMVAARRRSRIRDGEDRRRRVRGREEGWAEGGAGRGGVGTLVCIEGEVE